MNELDYLNNQRGYAAPAAAPAMTIDQYVARAMQRVFGKMFLGILATAIVSLAIASSPGLLNVFFSNSIVPIVLMVAQIGVVIFLSARINKMSAQTGTMLFYIYAVLTGITLTPIFLIYTGAAIVKTFFITAGTFGAMAAYGYFSKKDLTKIGSLLFMALIGLIIASVVNLFLHSSALEFGISIVGVLIFVGLTAFDTQKIKQMAAETDETNVGKLATMGALSLYLDFINLFLYLLRIFGSRD